MFFFKRSVSEPLVFSVLFLMVLLGFSHVFSSGFL